MFLVVGCNGQLGNELKLLLQDKAIYVDKDELDITDKNAVDSFFAEHNVDAIINCAAYTAVDKAESDIENARLVNATATKYLAQSTAKQNIPFIHISTDYVFDGMISEHRKETDEVNPINIYGQTKLEGEDLALAINPRTIIIRTSWVYSKYGNNFVKTMLRLFQERTELNVINDQIGSPTNAMDLAEVIIQIVLSQKITYGIFNYSNEGKCSWFDFALKIKEFSNSNITINPIPTTAYPTPAKRPNFSLLDKSKIKTTYQISVPDWESSLERMIIGE